MPGEEIPLVLEDVLGMVKRDYLGWNHQTKINFANAMNYELILRKGVPG